jgi:hypothetical protein
MNRSLELRQKDRWAVILAAVEWSDLGVPERVIALQSREIKVGRSIAVPRPAAGSIEE